MHGIVVAYFNVKYVATKLAVSTFCCLLLSLGQQEVQELLVGYLYSIPSTELQLQKKAIISHMCMMNYQTFVTSYSRL